jgi:two-component system, NtrC family, sensor kinase
MKLTRKLTLALFLVVLLVISGFAYVRVERELALFDSDMRRDHQIMSEALRSAVLELWESQGEQPALGLVRRANADRQHLELRWAWPMEGTPSWLPPDRLQALAQGQPIQAYSSLPSLGSGEYLISYTPVRVPDGRLGAIAIAESQSHKAKYLQNTVLITVLSAIVLALVFGVVAMVIGRWFVGAPVSKLIAKARRIGSGDLAEPLVLNQADEFGELARELNAMCDELATARIRLDDETTARIQALEQLRHADRLTTIGQLTSVIAHEIGTPLNVASGHAQLLCEDPVDHTRTSERARIIVEQCRRMAGIVRLVLDYARRREPRKSTVDMRDLVKSTVDLVGTLARKQDVEIVMLDDQATAFSTEVDSAQMQQALTNLLVNAVQASSPGQTVSVHLKRGAEPELCIAVVDHGRGMTEEVKQRLFEPFFTTKAVGQGTGLGLTIASGIVGEHGGRIEVQSVLEGGSIFQIRLPMEARP